MPSLKAYSLAFEVLQAAQMARIFRLADSKRDIIFVAPKHIHEDVLDYYSKIMQFRGVANPPGRFQVVVPENMGLKDKLSLTQALLCSPKALKRIQRLVSNRMAMLIPEVVTFAEGKLSNTLRLPLIGPSARNMSLLSSKSNGKADYNTIQYNTIQYNTIQYSTVQYSTVQYRTEQYSTVQYSTVQYSTVLYNTIQNKKKR